MAADEEVGDFTDIMTGRDLSPVSMMLSVINSERYSPVTI